MAPPRETRYIVPYGRLIDACRKRGIRTQTRLSELLGLSRYTINDYNKNGWIDENFKRLAELLDTTTRGLIAELDAEKVDGDEC